MPGSKRFYVAASVSETKGIDCILQIPVIYAVNLSSCGKDHFPGFYLLSGADRTVCLYHTSKAHMCSTAYMGIMVYHCTAVYKHSVLHYRMGVDYRPLHNKASFSDHGAGAYYGRRMDHSRNFISGLHQLFCPVKTHIVISKSRYRHVVFPQKALVIAAFPHNILISYGVV